MSVFRRADMLFLRLYPVWLIALAVGALGGSVFLALGVGTYLDLIDPGADFRAIDPLYIAICGVGMVTGAAMGWIKLGTLRRAALARTKVGQDPPYDAASAAQRPRR